MKMSVSMSRSATRPRVTGRSNSLGDGSERSCEGSIGIRPVAEVLIDCVADHLRHREAFHRRDAIDPLPLFIGEIHLSPR